MNTHELHAAVVASDPQVIDSIPFSLRKIGIEATVFQDAQSAIQAMGTRKLDAFFVDRELDPELCVLQEMRAARGNRKALGFAIIPREQTPGGAFRVADFLIDKPLIGPRVHQALRAAHGIMLKERMRYFRKSLRTTMTLIGTMGHTTSAMLINISQGGVALESEAGLSVGQLQQMKFRLDADEKPLNCLGRVIWTDEHGKAGLCFTDISSDDRQQLAAWIEREFDKASAA